MDAFYGLSHADIKNVLFSALRNVILSYRDCLTNCDVIKEIYFHRNHTIDNEDEFISYLLSHGVTHKELNEGLAIPLRKIQSVSKSIDRKEG